MVKHKQFLKSVVLLFICFISSFYFKGNLNIIFTIPLIGFCLFNGLSYFLLSIIGVALGSFTYYYFNNQIDPAIFIYLLLSLSIYFILHYVFLIFKRKLIINYFLSIFLTLLITYSIYFFDVKEIELIDFLLCLLLSAIISLLSSFIIKNFSLRIYSYQNDNAKLLVSLICIAASSFISMFWDTLLMSYLSMFFIIVFLLIYVIKNTFKDTLILLSAIFIMSALFNINIIANNLYLIFILGCALSFLPTKRSLFRLFIVLSCFIINAALFNFNKENLYYDISLALLSGLISLFISSKNKKQNINNDFLRYNKSKKEISYQLDNFQNMFYQIATNFKQSRETKILTNVKKEVFDILCKDCPNLNNCHYNGKHLLLNYIKDSLNDNLTDEKIALIKEKCVKQENYFKMLDKFTKNYLLKQYQDEENARLKELVYENFLGFSKIMTQCKKNFSNDKLLIASTFYSSLKLALSNYKYDIIYINNHSTYDSYLFEIAIGNIRNKDIKEILLPLICETLQCKMNIVSINTTTLTYSYFILTVKEVKKHKISIACKQTNEDYKINGDCYSYFDDSENYYLAISDGMGNGFNANEESKFTIDILFSILKTKMDIKNSIVLTNELIHLKNETENYTTLDFLAIDKQNLKATFLKFGAFTTFIVRDKKVYDISNYSLPLGIIDEIKYSPSEFILKENDIIIMCSDGMIDDNNEEINNILSNVVIDDVNVICQTLFSQLLFVRKNNDDATLAILTIN